MEENLTLAYDFAETEKKNRRSGMSTCNCTLKPGQFIGDTDYDIIISKKAKVRSSIIPLRATSIEEIERLQPSKLFYDYREIENSIGQNE